MGQGTCLYNGLQQVSYVPIRGLYIDKDIHIYIYIYIHIYICIYIHMYIYMCTPDHRVLCSSIRVNL